jgi:hypothetical protein
MKIKLLGFLCLFVLLSASGCGSSAKAKHISTEEVNLALDRQTLVLGNITCIRDEQRHGNSGTALGEISKEQSLKIRHAVKDLVAAYRKNPASMRTMMAEEAESLQSCWPWLTTEIRTVLLYG